MCDTFRQREYEMTMARSSDSKNKVEEEKRLTTSKFAYVADQQIEAIRDNLDAL